MLFCHSLGNQILVFVEERGQWVQQLDLLEFFDSISDLCWKVLIPELCPVLQYCFAVHKVTTAQECEDKSCEHFRVISDDARQHAKIDHEKQKFNGFDRNACLQDIEKENCRLDELRKQLGGVEIELRRSQSKLLSRVTDLGVILVPALDMMRKTRKNVFVNVHYRIEGYLSYFCVGSVLPDKYIESYKKNGTFDERLTLGVYFLKGNNAMAWSASNHTIERESVELHKQIKSCIFSIECLYAHMEHYDNFIANPPKFVPTKSLPITPDEPIIRHYLAGKSYRTIAELLHLHVALVTRRLTRCRKTLRHWQRSKCFLGDLNKLLTKPYNRG
jgi:hypothetical protein